MILSSFTYLLRSGLFDTYLCYIDRLIFGQIEDGRGDCELCPGVILDLLMSVFYFVQFCT